MMPAVELGEMAYFSAPPSSSLPSRSINGINGVGRLRKHKILPHPREARLHELYPPTSATTTTLPQPRGLALEPAMPVPATSVPSADAASPRTLKHPSRRSIGRPGGLPPTPPTHSRQSSGSHPLVPASPVQERAPSTPPASDEPAVPPRTPPNQQSPPTPEVTPPRTLPLPRRMLKHERYPSSRTDSFKTARENASSDDEDAASTVRPPPPPPPLSNVRGSETETETSQIGESQNRGPQRRREVGLGLGLESDNEGTTTPKALTNASEREFVIFDGEWAPPSPDGSEVEREWDANLMRNVTVRKRRRPHTQIFTDGHADEVVEDHLITPTNATRDATRVLRNIPLHERIARHRRARDAAHRASSEQLPEPITPPNPGDDEPESSPVTTADVRRFSGASARSHASTVIEAMVVDAPPTRRKTLRHVRKQSGLRDLSSDYSTASTAPTSVAATEPRQRLHHAAGRIPEHRHHSLTPTGTTSTTSSSGRSRRDVMKTGGIPVVVVPDRRSSSKSSKTPSLRSTSSRRTKRSQSLHSAPLSHSSKYNEPGYFDTPPPRKRTVSESAGSAPSVRTMDFAPEIPARRSSLSAPTSRNTSRAGSLTAESLHAHNLVHAPEGESRPPELGGRQQSIDSQKESTQHTRLSVDQNGDPFFGNRLSTQVTPFSQASYETAGTNAEVSEAMAVSIYPHQNRSVLVVQQKATSDPSSSHRNSSNATPPVLHTPDAVPAQASMTVDHPAVPGPVTPPQPTHPMDAVDSPLRNPRAPPAPPAIKFIPPTPAALTPAAEEDRQLGYTLPDRPTTSSADDRPPPSGALSLMRRAFSHRRNSMTAAQPGPGGFLKRAFSLSNRRGGNRDVVDEATQTSKAQANPSSLYPSVADEPADGTRLHPFWRPARFWDDLEDGSGSESESEPERERSPEHASSGAARPGMPKRRLSERLKKTFAILPAREQHETRSDEVRDGERRDGLGAARFRRGTSGRSGGSKHDRLRSEERRTMHRTPSGNMRVVKTQSSLSLRREAERRRVMLEARGARAREGFGVGDTLASTPLSGSGGTSRDTATKDDGDPGAKGVRGDPGVDGHPPGSGETGPRGMRVPGLGVRVEYVGWSGLKRKVEERRRERRVEVLRGTISAPRGVRSGVDDVLRGMN